MSCSSCGGGGGGAPFSPAKVRQMAARNVVPGDCIYTAELLNEWRNLLLCIKNQNIYDIFGVNHVRVNAHLGIVQSAINYTTFPCYFSPQLEDMTPLIEAIKNSNKC